MSIPRRLLRIASQRLRDTIDGVDLDWLAGDSARRESTREAERELQDFLRDRAPAGPDGPSVRAVDPLAEEYALLGVTADADAEELQRAWHRCVKENHPDLYAGDPVAQSAAKERFLRVQLAYRRVLEARGGAGV
jgi:DnaJ-domain-containing protein 1